MTESIAEPVTNVSTPKLSTHPRALRKWEACGALCELADHVRDKIKWQREYQEKHDGKERQDIADYRQKEIDQY